MASQNNFKSRKQTYAKYAHRWPKLKKEEAEFGPGKREFVICPECENVYFDKSWKPGLNKEKIRHLKAEKRLKFSICPACRMIKNEKFEGQVILKNVPERFKKDILNTIANMAEQAYEKDPQDRIIKVQSPPKESRFQRGPTGQAKSKIQNNIEILTTENQLAVRIAKKISQTFKGKLEIQHSYQEDPIRAKVIWGKD